MSVEKWESDILRALILLNGELDISAWGLDPSLSGPWDLVICADGGGRHALRLAIKPDLLLGDFDSLSLSQCHGLQPAEMISYPAAKDKTDGQLAVEEALRRGATDVVLAGALGGRLDHTLANVGLLRLVYRHGASGVATDGQQLAYLVVGELRLCGLAGQLFSPMPLSTRVEGVWLEGARWTLSGDALEIGDTRPLSNEFLGGRLRISVGSGELLVVVQLPRARL